MRKAFILALILALALAGICGCASQKQAQQPVQKVTVGMESDITGMESSGLSMCYLLYEPLVNLKLQDGAIEKVPYLAESWEHNDNRTVWTFHLRKGVKFHDNTEFDSGDVKFTFERALKGKILAFATIRSIQKIECPDEHKIVFTLNKPGATFLSDIALIGMESSTIPLDEKENVVKPVGTGPFVFKEWQKGQSVVLKRFDQYWQGKTRLQEIVFKVIPDAQTRMMAVKAGDIDLMYGWGILSLVPTMKNTPNVSVLSVQGQGQTFMYVNGYTKSFDDKNIRLALAYAVNRKEICDQLNDLCEPDSHLFAARFKKYLNEDAKAPDMDIARARQLLAESGWTDADGDGIVEKNGQRFQVSLSYSPKDDYAKAAVIIQKQLKAVGIDVKVAPVEAFETVLREKKYELAIASQSYIPHDEPCNYYIQYYSSKTPQGYQIYTTPDLDQSVVQLMTSVDENARLKLHREIQQKIIDTGTVMPLYSSRVTFALQNRVKGFTCPPTYAPWWQWSTLKDAWVE